MSSFWKVLAEEFTKGAREAARTYFEPLVWVRDGVRWLARKVLKSLRYPTRAERDRDRMRPIRHHAGTRTGSIPQHRNTKSWGHAPNHAGEDTQCFAKES